MVVYFRKIILQNIVSVLGDFGIMTFREKSQFPNFAILIFWDSAPRQNKLLKDVLLFSVSPFYVFKMSFLRLSEVF